MVSLVGADAGGADNVATISDLSWPAGVQAGDCALLFWTMINTASPSPEPSGFTLKQSHDGDSGSIRSRFYRKVCTGSESGALALTASATNRHTAVLLVLRGTHATEPVDTWDVRDEGAGTTSHACPGVVTGFANCVGVAAVAERASTGTTNWTTTWNERADSTTLATGSGGTITAIADDGLASGRASGAAITPPNWVSGNGFSSGNVTTWTVSIRPGVTDQTVPAGQATETETAQPITPVRTVPIGPAVETNAAQLVAGGEIVPFGQATEADAATRFAAPTTRASEAESAGVITPVRIVPIGQASETGAAAATAITKTRVFGQAVETDSAAVVGPRVALAPETLLNGVPIPLGVRIYNNFTPALDVWVTRALDDFSFRSSIPGGFASATITLHRPSIAGSPAGGYLFNADKEQFDQLARLFNRVQIVDMRSAEIVWEGRIEGPRRSSDSDTWELSCLGAAVVASDIQRPMFYIDSSIESWLAKPENFWQFQTDEATKVIEVRWEGNLIWPGPAGSGFALFTALTWQRGRECGLYVGRYDITFASSAPSGTGNQAPTHLWNSVHVGGVGSQGDDGELDATNFTQNIRHMRRVNDVLNNFGTTGGWQFNAVEFIEVEMGVGNGFGDYTSAPDKVVGRIANPLVQVLRRDRTGAALTAPADYPNEYVTLPQVVEDVVGRFLVGGWDKFNTDTPWPGHVRPIDLYMDTSSPARFTHLTYFDGTTAEGILADMMIAQPEAFWAIWESRWGATDQSGDRNLFGHRFEWATWPLSWGYQASSLDGLEEQPTGEGLYNYVFYKIEQDSPWNGTPGRKDLKTAWSARHAAASSSPVAFFEDSDLSWGRVPRAITVTREEPTDDTTANTENKALLSRYRKTGNSGTITIRRPIHYFDPGSTSYAGASRMVQPWEIRPGKLIRLTDVMPRGMIQDHSHGQVAPPETHDGTVWRVVATEYSSSDNSCRLELDQPTAWSLPTQIVRSAAPQGPTVKKG